MKIILSEDDIIDLVNKAFSGVEKVELKATSKDNFLIEMEVDKNVFSPIAVQTGTIVKDVNKLSPPVEQQERKLVTIKPKYSSEEQKRRLEQAEKMNQAQNERNERNRMAKPGEERRLARVG